MNQCDPLKCPIPICNMPEILSLQQIKAILAYKNIPLKEVAFDLGITISRVWYILNRKRSPEALQNVSDYVRRKMLDVQK